MNNLSNNKSNLSAPLPLGGAGGRLYAERKEQQKKINKVEKAVKECEAKIEQLEQQIKEMDKLLYQPEHATDMELIGKYTTVKQQLDELNDQWLLLSERLEEERLKTK